MQLNLYSYNDIDDVVNKFKVAALKYSANDNDGSFALYGDFDPRTAVFTLNRAVECNYASYDYNGLLWCGYVKVSNVSGDLWMYSVDIDPLTMAYANDCTNTYGRIIASRNYYPCLYDSRIGQKEQSEFVELSSTLDMSDYAIVFNVFNVEGQYNSAANQSTTPNSAVTYIMPNMTGDIITGIESPNNALKWNAGSNWSKFIKAIRNRTFDTSAGVWLSSIINAYVIPQAYVNVLFKKYPDLYLNRWTKSIHLAGMPNSLVSGLLNFDTINITGGDTADAGFRAYALGRDMIAPLSVTFNIGDHRGGDRWGQLWTINLPFIGSISFTPANLLNEKIIRLRADATLNVVNATYTLQLFGSSSATEDNWVEFKNLRISQKIPETLILPNAGENQNGAMLGEIGGAITTLATSAISGSATGVVGGALSLGKTALDITSGAGVSGGYTGSSGGSPDRPIFAKNPTLYYIYKPYRISADIYASTYGYINDRWGNVSSQGNGYIQTDDIHMPLNGVDSDIIIAAQNRFNNGVRFR